MATFTAVVSDPESGLSYQVDVDGQDGNRFVGREIGDSVDGDAVGLPGYTVAITGGSDAAGRPMHEAVGGAALSEELLSGRPGFRPERDGERRRVTVRGREVGDQTVQLNLRIEERGEQHVEVLLGDADPEDFADEEPEEAGEEKAEADDEDEEEPDEEAADAEEEDDEEPEEADEETAEAAEEDDEPEEAEEDAAAETGDEDDEADEDDDDDEDADAEEDQDEADEDGDEDDEE
jgi:small subunit ribosomal protein S6e